MTLCEETLRRMKNNVMVIEVWNKSATTTKDKVRFEKINLLRRNRLDPPMGGLLEDIVMKGFFLLALSYLLPGITCSANVLYICHT